jgi:hypothetical protein
VGPEVQAVLGMLTYFPADLAAMPGRKVAGERSPSACERLQGREGI